MSTFASNLLTSFGCMYVSHRLYNKMDDTSPLPLTIQKIKIKDVATLCIWSQTLCSSYWGLVNTMLGKLWPVLAAEWTTWALALWKLGNLLRSGWSTSTWLKTLDSLEGDPGWVEFGSVLGRKEVPAFSYRGGNIPMRYEFRLKSTQRLLSDINSEPSQ